MSATEHHGRVARQAWLSILFVLAGIALAPIRIRILTHVLTEAQFGIFNLLTTTAASIGFVALLGQRQYLIYALPGRNAREQGACFTSSLLVTLAAGVLFAALFLAGGLTIPLMARTFPPALIAVGTVFIVLYALAQFGMGYLLAVGEVVRYRLQVFLTSNLWLLAVVPFALRGGLSLDRIVLLWLAGLAVPMVWLAAWTRRSLGEGLGAPPRGAFIRESVKYGVPLISRNVANSLMRLADRYVILPMMGAASVGVYTVPVTLVGFAADTQYFLEFFFPHISVRWRANRAAGRPGCSGEASTYFHAALRICFLTTVPMGIGIVLWGDSLVRVLAGSSYAAASSIFLILVPQVILIPVCHFIHFALMLDGRTYLIGYSILGSAALNVLLNLVLIPRLGLAGAALAGTLSYFLLVLISLKVGRLWPHLRCSELRLPPLLAAGAAMTAAILLCRWFFRAPTPWEVPAAGVAFLGAGHLLRLWTRDELALAFRRKKTAAEPAP